MTKVAKGALTRLLDAWEKNPVEDEKPILLDTDIEWQCMACKEDRPDRFITITKIEIANEERSMPLVFRFRHCVDRVPCVALANRTRRGDYLIQEEP